MNTIEKYFLIHDLFTDTCLPSDECPPGSHAQTPNSQLPVSNDEIEGVEEEAEAPLPLRPKVPAKELQRIEAEVEADNAGSSEEISNKQVVKLLKQLLRSHRKTASSHASVPESSAAKTAPHTAIVAAPAVPSQGKAKINDVKSAQGPAASPAKH